ncbi:MAG: OmpA family protein [Spirochaetes bacterium]|nr:OmpA family protein [Spirochaetota bacterium]
MIKFRIVILFFAWWLGSSPLLNSSENDDNKEKADQLIKRLYFKRLGVQREYLPDPSNPDNPYLALYGRIWAFTQGLTLRDAVRNGNREKAHQMAKYLLKRAIKISLKDGKEIIGGWPFSENMVSDTFQDVRLMTGPNAWVLSGLGQYVCSDMFNELTRSRREEFKDFYSQALDGLLYHQREDSLFTAGWTTEALKQAQGKTNYYEILNKEGYSQVKKVKADNVVTRHNVNMLEVLNYSINNFDKLGLKDLKTLVRKQDQLSRALFTKLYDNKAGRFVTALEKTISAEIQSRHTELRNASWLALSINYYDITEQQKEKLAKSLQYTVKHFVRDMEYKDASFFGAHYYLNDYQDPYILPSASQEKAYHIEGTAALILALDRFSQAFPEHASAAEFKRTAARLWSDMQKFVKDHGFPYATHQVKDLMTTLQSSTSAIWYNYLYDYYILRMEDFTLKKSKRGLELKIQNDILFQFDSTRFTKGAEKILSRVTLDILKHPRHLIRIEGHTDNTGTTKYNYNLSKKRALAVYGYLAGQGIEKKRMIAIGMGEWNPVTSNKTPAGRQMNRRVDIVLTEMLNRKSVQEILNELPEAERTKIEKIYFFGLDNFYKENYAEAIQYWEKIKTEDPALKQALEEKIEQARKQKK